MSIARISAALLGVAVLSAPLLAFAQQAPPAPPNAPAPTYARPILPSSNNNEEAIHGRISSFDGKYHIEVRDDRGFIDNVELHQGTVINPTGLSLQPGMLVTIMGYNRGHVFAAQEIDTPYQTYGPVPMVYPYGYSIGVGLGPVYYHR
jgi:hypothetical protein